MTVKETEKIQDLAERAARMEQNQENMTGDIKEIKDMLKSQDRRFVTRAELKITQWVVGFIISIITFALIVKDHLKV